VCGNGFQKSLVFECFMNIPIFKEFLHVTVLGLYWVVAFQDHRSSLINHVCEDRNGKFIIYRDL
jgi:hypothetical protein